MRRIGIIISFLLVAFGSINIAAAEKDQNPAPKNSFKLYGFIRNYMPFDTRESVSGTGDLFYYLPKDVLMNADGTEDINANSSFRFLALTSRLGVDVSGYNVGNVHFGAKIEGDFYSGLSKSSNANASLYFPSNTSISGTAQARLRQAYATVTWKGTEEDAWKSVGVKIGQAWHPMAADMPHLFSLEAGAPFGPFSRTPQLLVDAARGKFVFSAAAIWQQQYQSNGPIGASAMYMKYGKTPEMYAAVTYSSKGFLMRAGVDVLSIKPRCFSTKKVSAPTDTDPEATKDVIYKKVSDRHTSVLGYVFAQYSYKKFGVKAKTTFGQGGEHMNLMSGYAKIGENPDGSWEYAPLRSSSSWLSLTYGKKWQGVLYLGYIKCLGLADPVEAGKIASTDVYFCGNGFSNINQMYRINPQIIYNIGKLNVGLEYQITSVQYGDYQVDGKVKYLDANARASVNPEWVTNHRINMMVKYNF